MWLLWNFNVYMEIVGELNGPEALRDEAPIGCADPEGLNGSIRRVLGPEKVVGYVPIDKRGKSHQ
jgi:hypothetical protein